MFPKLVISEPADGLAPNGATPSAGTSMTTKLATIIFLTFLGY